MFSCVHIAAGAFSLSPLRMRRLSCLLALALAACTGTIEQKERAPTTPDLVVTECTDVVPAAGERELQRLTSKELDRSVAAILGDTTGAFAARLVSSDEVISPKQRFFRARSGTTVWAEAALLAAEEVSLAAAVKPQFSTCTGGDERACVRALIEQYGRRLWRRTLTTTEVDGLLVGYDAARAEGTWADGVQTSLQSLLASPDFFFFQQPVDGVVAGTVLAERLASTLWHQAPDDALLDAAEQGVLETPEGLEVQVARLLADRRADETFADFIKHWIAPEKVNTIEESLAATTRQPTLYPLFKAPADGADGLAYDEALDAFLATEARVTSGSFESLLLSRKLAVNEAVARNLGLSAATALELRDTDSDRRLGLLGQPAVLTAYGRFESSDPVHRGVFLLRHALCNDLPPPDASVNTSLPAADQFNTTRDRFSTATTVTACRGCHALINPLGFAFENFDAVGRFRLTENGHPVDATAKLPTSPPANVDGLADLARVLVNDRQVRACVARQFSTWALRRAVTQEEYCSMRNQAAPFFEESGSLSALVTGLLRSEAFSRPSLPGSAP